MFQNIRLSGPSLLERTFFFSFSQIFPFFSKVSQSSGKAKANMMEDKSRKKARSLEFKEDETKVDTHVGPFVGPHGTRKNYVTKMNSLKKKHLQTHFLT